MPTPIKYLLGFLVPVVTVVCLLSFGNPQWGKWVYMWQAYILSDNDTVEIPLDYTGNWMVWNENGNIYSVSEYARGINVGASQYYYPSGKLRYVCSFDSSGRVEKTDEYYESAGGLKRTIVYKVMGKIIKELYKIDYYENQCVANFRYSPSVGTKDDEKYYYNIRGGIKKAIIKENSDLVAGVTLDSEKYRLKSKFTGYRSQSLDSNKVINYFNYKNGKIDGVHRWYYSDGRISIEQNFRNGEFLGIHKRFSKKGDLEYCVYKDDKKSCVVVFDKFRNIDLRPQYAKEIAEFEKELAAFEAANVSK